MAYKNTAITVTYLAWDTVNNVGKTGDGANHTLRGVGDGTEFTPATPNITEVDSTNCPGLYKATFASGENNYTDVTLHGKSSTSGIVLIPTRWQNESNANTVQVLGGAMPAVSVTGVPKVDLQDILGTGVSTPATAGILDVNVKNMNNVAATAITTIKAVQGLTTADTIATYTGNTPQTGDSFAIVKSGGTGDNAAIKTQTDKLAFTVANKVDANVYTWNGTAVATPATAGVPEVDVKAINNVATTPVTTIKAVQGLTTADTIATYTGNTPQTGDAFARIGATGSGLSSVLDLIESQRGHHTFSGTIFYVDGFGGNDSTGTGSRAAPYKTISKAYSQCVDGHHDLIECIANSGQIPTVITESSTIVCNKSYVLIRGPGRGVKVTLSGNGYVFTVSAVGAEIGGFWVVGQGVGGSGGIVTSSGADFPYFHDLYIDTPTQDGIQLVVSNYCRIQNNLIFTPGRDGVRFAAGAGVGKYNNVWENRIVAAGGSGVNFVGNGDSESQVRFNTIRECATGVNIAAGATDIIVTDNRLAGNTANITDAGTNTLNQWNFLATDATGHAGVNWADITNPTATEGLSGTTVGTATNVTNDVGITQAGADKVWSSASRTLTAFAFTVGSNLTQILGSALTEGAAGRIVAAFKKFFDVNASSLTTGGVDQTGDSFARIGVAGVGLTNLGDARLANLDATISSRTKPADTQAAVTIVTNLTNAPTAGDFTAAMKTSLNNATPSVTVSDKTGFSLSAAGIQAIWDALTSALTTVGSVGKLLVDNINATISSRLASASYTAPDNADIATILTRTDVATSTRLASASYTAPDNADIATILTRTDVATSTRLATSGYTAPDNADIALIKAKTDNLPASPAATGAQMDLVNAPNATALKAIADAKFDEANGIETGVTERQAERIMLSVLAGKADGFPGNPIHYRDVNDTTDRITATTDANGNRTVVTLNGG